MSARRSVAGLLLLATALRAQEPALPPPAHEHPHELPPPAADPRAPGLRPFDVGFSLGVAAGTSTERDAELARLQGGAHDPRKRGFTLQEAELSLHGSLDPAFDVEAHVVLFVDPLDGETVIELEEAFGTVRGLSSGLALDVGVIATAFGRANAQHAHDRDWLDQTIVNSRVFGPDGMRGPGAALRWQSGGDPCVHVTLGVQNGNGETMASFLANEELYGERPVGGRAFTEVELRSFADVVWSARAVAEADAGGGSRIGLGASAAYGPNATGPSADTFVYGADATFTWRECFDAGGGTGRSFRLQGEFIGRAFEAADQVDTNDPLVPGDDVAVPGETLRDHGVAVQGLFGFSADLDAGLRGEWVGGTGASYDAATDTFGRDADPFRDDRWRVSPLLAWRASSGTRIRFQYSYDEADHLDDSVHSVWIGFEWTLGGRSSHASHGHAH